MARSVPATFAIGSLGFFTLGFLLWRGGKIANEIHDSVYVYFTGSPAPSELVDWWMILVAFLIGLLLAVLAAYTYKKPYEYARIRRS